MLNWIKSWFSPPRVEIAADPIACVSTPHNDEHRLNSSVEYVIACCKLVEQLEAAGMLRVVELERRDAIDRAYMIVK